MTVPLLEWLPRSSAINLLAGAFLLATLFAVAQRRTASCIRAYAIQSWCLGGITAVVAATTHARHLWIATVLVLAVKGVVIPRILGRGVVRARLAADTDPLVGVPASMLLCGAMVVVAFAVTRPLFGDGQSILASCLPISVAAALVALFLMVARRHALLQVIGLVLLENAIFLATVSLTSGMPLVVEIGVLLDVIVGAALLALFVTRIEETFETSDVGRLTSLKG